MNKPRRALGEPRTCVDCGANPHIGTGYLCADGYHDIIQGKGGGVHEGNAAFWKNGEWTS